MIRLDLPDVPGRDSAAGAHVRKALDGKTKPPGSLGRLEGLAVDLAEITADREVRTVPRAIVVAAADHGVSRRGVSAFPREVTAQMVRNFAAGGAAINVLVRQMQAETVVIDVGVDDPTPPPEGVLAWRLAPGTEDFTERPAMSVELAAEAVGRGLELARSLADRGFRLVATGEMGIGNTTSAAALTAVFTGRAPWEVVGPGTGLGPDAVAHKVGVVTEALERHRPNPADPLATLAAVGGLEIAALAGVVIGAASRRLPVVLDGYITGAAALVAVALVPASVGALIASHRSLEPGHGFVLHALGLEPLLDLGLRLGEGSGAALALPLLDAAGRIVREMASFESAGVSGSPKR